MDKKILITGGAGFIGSHLVDLLIEEGVKPNSIRVLVKDDDPRVNICHGGLDIVRGDIRRLDDVKKCLKGVEIVYHLAAKTSLDGKSQEDFRDTNVEGTRLLVQSCKSSQIRKFVFFSSIAVYGLPAVTGDMVNWNENQVKNPVEGYGRSKLEAEKIVTKICKKKGIPYSIVRPSTVYGPRDHQGIYELYKAISGRYFFLVGNGQNKVDYVYVKDLVKGARMAQLNLKKSSDYILGSGRPITFKELANTVAKSLGVDLNPFQIPKNTALIASYVFYFAGKVCGFRSPIFPDRVKIMTTNCYFDITKARRQIGYLPNTSFEQGCNLTAQWLRKK